MGDYQYFNGYDGKEASIMHEIGLMC